MTEKEKFEEAKRLYQTANADQRYVLETLFPELKESEDERIRKILVEAVTQVLQDKYCSNRGVSKEKVVAWLEKQGELVNSLSKGLDNAHERIDELIQKNNELCIKLEKQGEQESTDKHEPKFKVYDWCIDNEDDIIFQIVKVLDNTYTYRTNEGKEYSCTHYSLENEARLWTIQDAKDGDVLATPNYIYIFNSIDKETETIAFYCLIKKSDKHFSFGDYRIHDEILNSTPATKKQYDILIKAMTDAGYTFNFEKKELKKIKQKSQRMVSAEVKEALYDKPAWSKEDDDMITTIEGWLDTLCEYLNDSSSEYISYIESCINWLESLRLQNMWKPSDEQIEALGVATDICSIPEKQYNELNKLYYELKKLKGE